MSGRDHAVSVERTLPGSPEAVYGLLCDTDRWDRLVGVTASTYSYALLDPDDPTSRTRIGRARSYGIPLQFAEEGEYWAPTRMRGERIFRGGVARWLRRGFLDVDLAPAAGGVRVKVRAGVATAGALGFVFGLLVRLRFAFVLRAYLRGLARVLAGARTDADQPAALQGRQALAAARTVSKIVAGTHGKLEVAQVAPRLDRFAAAPVDGEVRRRIVDLIATRPDEAVRAIKPFELARAWGADGVSVHGREQFNREVVRGFLHAARAGLFELEWQVNCPVCRVGAGTAPQLDRLGHRLHCGECDVSYDVDFADHVEATFTVSPAIRTVRREVYCASSPSWRPHVHGYVTLPPRTTRDVGPLPPGDLVVRARGTVRQLRVVARPAEARITDDAIVGAAPDPAAAEALRLVNDTDRAVRILVERAGWQAERVSARTLMTLPDFIELYAADAPATGVQLAVGELAIVFTDVVGSTALYEDAGDARAFALVQAHWRGAARIAAEHQGAVVKTLGDGLLLSFPTVARAVAATLAIMDDVERLGAREGVALAIRAGIHEGPCYLVRATDRADLFGRTVNLAARLGTVGAGQQIALLDRVLAHPSTLALLELDDVTIDHRAVELRGLPGLHRVALIARAGAAIATTGKHPKVTRPTP